MEHQIYQLDQKQIGTLRKRTFKNFLGLILLGIFMVIAVQYYYLGREDFQLYVFMVLFTLSIILGVTYFSINNAVKGLSRLQLILSQEGVECSSDTTGHKKISWRNLEIQESQDGAINLFDKSISKVNTKWNGKGLIHIFPEIENRERLLTELKKHRA